MSLALGKGTVTNALPRATADSCAMTKTEPHDHQSETAQSTNPMMCRSFVRADALCFERTKDILVLLLVVVWLVALKVIEVVSDSNSE